MICPSQMSARGSCLTSALAGRKHFCRARNKHMSQSMRVLQAWLGSWCLWEWHGIPSYRSPSNSAGLSSEGRSDVCLFSMFIIVWPWMETTNTEMLKIYPNTSIESNKPICKVVLCCHKIINHCWTTEWDCLSDKLFPRYFGNQIACHNTSQNKSFRVKKGIYFWVEACHCLP